MNIMDKIEYIYFERGHQGIITDSDNWTKYPWNIGFDNLLVTFAQHELNHFNTLTQNSSGSIGNAFNQHFKVVFKYLSVSPNGNITKVVI